MIIIDGKKQIVNQGDAIFIPSDSEHGIENNGKEKLLYLTANKPFGKEREIQIWPINE